jgi:hypothetical protein
MIIALVYMGLFFLVVTGVLMAVLITYNKKNVDSLFRDRYLPPEEDPVPDTLTFGLDGDMPADFYAPEPFSPGTQPLFVERPPIIDRKPALTPIATGDNFLTEAKLPERELSPVYNWPFWTVLALYLAYFTVPNLIILILMLLFL